MGDISWENLEKYLRIEKNLSERTLKGVRFHFKIFRSFIHGSFTEENCDRFVLHLKETLSESSHNSYMALLRHIGHCFKIEFVKKYKYLAVKRSAIEVLTPQEINKLATTYIPRIRGYRKTNYRYKVAILTLGTTGLRISELCNLKWEDVQEDRILIKDTKFGKSRIVPILPMIHRMMRKLPAHLNGYVFGSNRSKLCSQRMNEELRERAQRAHIHKKVYNHLFRHSFITTCLQEDQNPFKVARIVGHKDLKTTLRYTHLVVDDLFNVINAHPLAKDKINFDMIKVKVKEFLETITADKFSIEFTERKKEVILRVLKEE